MAFAPSIYWPVDQAWSRERAAAPPAWEAQGNRYLAKRALGFEHAGSGSLTLVVPVLRMIPQRKLACSNLSESKIKRLRNSHCKRPR